MRKILISGLLVVACGLIAVFVFDFNPLARAKPEDQSLDQLLAGMEVEVFPDRKIQVDVFLKDLSGSDVNVTDFRGKIVFLNFWATWCPSCVVEMPAMEKLYQKFKDKDFAMVSVSIQDPPLAVKRFFLINKLNFTALLDQSGKTIPGFGIRAIPTTLILDKSGRIFGRVMGPREWDSRESIAMFKLLIDNPF